MKGNISKILIFLVSYLKIAKKIGNFSRFAFIETLGEKLSPSYLCIRAWGFKNQPLD